MTQTSISTSTSRKFFGGGGVQRPGGGDENFWSYGRGILLRRPSGSPRRISATRTHSKKMYEQVGFPRNSSPVFEDRNFSPGGRSCGKSWSWLGVAMDTSLAWCRIGTSEPIFGEDQSCSLGRIAQRVPVS